MVTWEYVIIAIGCFAGAFLLVFGLFYLLGKMRKCRCRKMSEQVITRHEIAEYTKSQGKKELNVIEHENDPQIPMSLKWKSRTYAMIYTADDGLSIIVALEDEYAIELSKIHTGMHHPKFPNGPHWYSIPVNNKAFKSKGDVYKLLDHACEFVANKDTRGSKKA